MTRQRYEGHRPDTCTAQQTESKAIDQRGRPVQVAARVACAAVAAEELAHARYAALNTPAMAVMGLALSRAERHLDLQAVEKYLGSDANHASDTTFDASFVLYRCIPSCISVNRQLPEGPQTRIFRERDLYDGLSHVKESEGTLCGDGVRQVEQVSWK
jgi:hypothetical protein